MLSALISLLEQANFILPEPEKTAIFLQPIAPLFTDRILEPVRSTPLYAPAEPPVKIPITLYISPCLSVTVKGTFARWLSVAAAGVISTVVVPVSAATTKKKLLELFSLETCL